MNLVDLYEQTPVKRHRDIKVLGDRVLVKDTDGDIIEYLLLEDNELWLIRSDKKLKAAVEAIKKKVGA